MVIGNNLYFLRENNMAVRHHNIRWQNCFVVCKLLIFKRQKRSQWNQMETSKVPKIIMKGLLLSLLIQCNFWHQNKKFDLLKQIRFKHLRHV